jgi:hypothetical protein
MKGQDPFGLGRWSFIMLRGKNDTRLTIITAYRVCQKASLSRGVKTAYMQQVRALKNRNLTDHVKTAIAEPNRQFILDLQAWIQHIKSQGHLIILNLENNEDLYAHEGSVHPFLYQPDKPIKDTTDNSSLRTLAVTCGLIDILAIHHSSRPFPATHIRGQKRIDYMLISAPLQAAVERSGILPYHSVFSGDHRPYYLDFNADLLFSGSTSPLAPPCQRSLQLSDPRKVNSYKLFCMNTWTITRWKKNLSN